MREHTFEEVVSVLFIWNDNVHWGVVRMHKNDARKILKILWSTRSCSREVLSRCSLRLKTSKVSRKR